MDEASPRFRQDLVAVATEAEGVPCVDVSDPATGNNFRFYDFEYQLALQLNGQPLQDVTAWASAAYGVDLTAEGIGEFAGRLAELGFLEPAGSAPAATPAPVAASAPAEATPPPFAVTPPPEAPAPPADTLDNAEAEWMTNEGAQTATFIPDPAMFENSPGEPTPVSPDLPRVEAELAAARNGAASRTRDAGTPVPPAPGKLFDIPAPTAASKAPTREIPLPVMPAGTRNPVAPPPPASVVPNKPASSWATELEDNLQGRRCRDDAAAGAIAVDAAAARRATIRAVAACRLRAAARRAQHRLASCSAARPPRASAASCARRRPDDSVHGRGGGRGGREAARPADAHHHLGRAGAGRGRHRLSGLEPHASADAGGRERARAVAAPRGHLPLVLRARHGHRLRDTDAVVPEPRHARGAAAIRLHVRGRRARWASCAARHRWKGCCRAHARASPSINRCARACASPATTSSCARRRSSSPRSSVWSTRPPWRWRS